MRVTEGMTFSQMRSQIGSAQARVYEAAQQASSGKRVAKSSDDPTSYSRAMVMNQSLASLDGMDRSANVAMTDLTTADDALSTSESILTRARELAVAGSNTTLSASDRASYAEEVANLRSQLLSQANARSGDTYVFAGGRTNQEAYSTAGTYQGDASVRTVEVAPNLTARANAPGDNIFSPAGGVNAFDVLATLENNLRTNNVSGVASSITGVDTAHAQIVDGRTDLGLQLQRTTDAGSARDSVRLQLEEARSTAVNTDTAASYTSLIQAQQSLESAIAAAQRMLSTMQAGLQI